MFTAVHKVLQAPGEGGVWENGAFCKREGFEDHAWCRT